MKYKIWYDDEHEVLMLKVLGEITRDDLPEIFSSMAELFQGKPRRFFLADVSGNFLEANLDKETRQAYRKGATVVDVDRTAFVGASPVIRMIAKIVLSLMGKSSSSAFFENRDEALRWLTEKPSD